MSEHINVLVTSSDLEDRTHLLHILEKLSLNVISCSTLNQAREVLSRQRASLVFCDESLSDGCYRVLLQTCKAKRPMPRLVVTIHRGEWDEYLEAMRLGVFDAIRWPLRPTDVELIVLRAMREDRNTGVPQQMIA